ncbi:PREDICTED: PIH1 domain-containing protein 1 [Crocodylus porosus]|nr:PREDICTED: PIH1 domain-containing protein 1 [Crocodylus porosus]
MAALTDKSLLSAELEEDGDGDGDEDEEFQRLLLQATQKIQSTMPSAPDSKPIRPQPGFCIKTHASPTEKVFVNVCRSPHIPPPPDLTPQELECLIESDSASAFRIPMSLGEPHAELDKSGNGCTAYDVVINTGFFNKLEANLLFKEFFITVALEGLAEKYSTNINHPEWLVLKNRKFMGLISEQTIRTKSRPIIQEMDLDKGGETQETPMELSHPQSFSVVPKFTIWAEPPGRCPDFLRAEIHLPQVASALELSLELGEDRIVLGGGQAPYLLDIYIPHHIKPERSRAQFHMGTKVLTVVMPIQLVPGAPMLLP